MSDYRDAKKLVILREYERGLRVALQSERERCRKMIAALEEITELSTTADSVYVEARNIALRALGREDEVEDE